MGDGADAIHLPPAGIVVNGHDAGGYEVVAPESEPLRNQSNYRITDADKIGVGSLKQKCRNNLAAIELLLAAETEGRSVPLGERPMLVRYIGWGGLPQVFDAHNEE